MEHLKFPGIGSKQIIANVNADGYEMGLGGMLQALTIKYL